MIRKSTCPIILHVLYCETFIMQSLLKFTAQTVNIRLKSVEGDVKVSHF